MTKPLPLPVDQTLPALIQALGTSNAAVLKAATGAGKTTRVPPALADAGLGPVIVLEPRRLAARAAARRIAAERGVSVGKEVGYHVRFDRKATKDTQILVVTEGILVRMLQRDPFLEGVGIVVLDEFHERHLFTDLSLAMTRRVQLDAREDLKLLVMSATLDPGPVAAFLGDCPVLESPGRQFEVDVRWLDKPDDRWLSKQVATAVGTALKETEGDVLVFLPGIREIRHAEEQLRAVKDARILPLYGSLSADKQDAVLRPGGKRKVVLATNVAESSVTIPGVTAVVDSGLVKMVRHDPTTGIDRLVEERISAASADQRTGRAGRTAPGVCYRLWTRPEQRRLAPRTPPELHRVDLAGTALELLCWGEADLTAFPWFEPPDAARIATAIQLLEKLDAVQDGRPTALGSEMVGLPVHPRIGRMLVESANLGHGEVGAMVAALLSERDVLRGERPNHSSGSDVLDRLDRLGPEHHAVHRVSKQLSRLIPSQPSRCSREEAIGRALLAGWPDRLARRRQPGSPNAVTTEGRGVVLSKRSAVRDAELFVCLDVEGKTGADAQVHIASGIERDWLDPTAIVDSVEAVWDGEGDRVLGLRRVRYHGLILDERSAKVDAAAASTLLAQRALADLERALPLDNRDVQDFIARVRSLAGWMPELDLPDFVDLTEVVHRLAKKRRSFADLAKAPLLGALKDGLDWKQKSALDAQAPEQIKVPSGSRVRLQYQAGEPPVLAVRMQEMFGLNKTPTVAGGRVPVRLHLLAPNRRPQQVTDDLAGFWERTWPQIRKELRARYPKHAWPEDPLTAKPLRGTKRRG